MPQTIRELMTRDPVTCEAAAPLTEAARLMRDADIGDVLVERAGALVGVVTDRDIVVRAVADGRNPAELSLADVCTGDLVTLGPDAGVREAVDLMRSRALRRIPVTEGGRPVGVVSLGDLAMALDEGSALSDISAAPPNN